MFELRPRGELSGPRVVLRKRLEKVWGSGSRVRKLDGLSIKCCETLDNSTSVKESAPHVLGLRVWILILKDWGWGLDVWIELGAQSGFRV